MQKVFSTLILGKNHNFVYIDINFISAILKIILLKNYFYFFIKV